MMKQHTVLAVVLIGFCIAIQHFTSVSGHEITREPLNFYEKVESIKPQIYLISVDELQELLGCCYPYVPTISAQDLREKMVSNPDLFVINVLSKYLFDDCHITGSHSVPLRELVKRAVDWPRDREIIVYCALDACDAGQKAYVLLSCMGFTNVTDYTGGIKGWFQLGYPTSGPANKPYLHAQFSKMPSEISPNSIISETIEHARYLSEKDSYRRISGMIE